MVEKKGKPYGLWPSPIGPAELAQALRLSGVAWDDDGETCVWLEGRSDRGVLVCAREGEAPRDLTTTLSVRARVGYGGGDFGVGGGYVYFVAQEGRLYRQALHGGEARPITPQYGHTASPTPSPDGRWVVYVYTHEGEDGLAIVDVEGTMWPQKLITGSDFYMQPRWHPDGTRIAWIAWDHPHMPWDSTRLQVAHLDLSAPGLPIATEIETVAPDPHRSDVAVGQPEFSPDGRWLTYLSDESGWTNLYALDLVEGTHRTLTTDRVDIGTPAWAQGMRAYAFAENGRLYYVRNEAGFSRLWACNVESGEAWAVESPLTGLAAYTALSHIAAPRKSGECLAFVASSSAISDRVVTVTLSPDDPHRAETTRVLRRSTAENIPPEALSQPRPLQWAAPDGTTVHGLYYPPTGTASGLPPAIINIHGGPTSQARAGYNPRAQFFATRGYAYLEVNYRGSTGYGKAYMAALHGKWGVLDVEDAVGGARHLVDGGLADGDRLVIMGGSAGGYTVLKALVDHPGFFRAALCLYGVSNMFTLAADTHKFEAHYLDSLLGPLPEASAVYRERSPVFYADRIVDPIALFQGEDDRVVPKAQSDAIIASLRRRGIPHEYHVYKGEGHGWRKRETIEAFYRAVEAFLRQYVIFA